VNDGTQSPNTDYVCWCDGEPTCTRRTDTEYGLCHLCSEQGHEALPPLPFSLAHSGP
jgi:hypothetical protein